MADRVEGRSLSVYRGAVVGGLVLLVAWPLFDRGAFFAASQYSAAIHAAVVLGLALILGAVERRSLALSPARIGALGLVGAYLLSLLVAAAPREAIQAVLRYGLYTMVFFAASEVIRSISGRRGAPSRVLGAVGLSGGAGMTSVAVVASGFWLATVAFALVNLMGMVGLLPLDVMTGGRLYTVLTYPNSAGSLAAAAFLLGLGLRGAVGDGVVVSPPSRARSRLLGALLSAGQAVLFAVFVLTLSRGAWLVFPIALVVSIPLHPKGMRLPVVVDATLGALAGLIIAVVLGLSSGAGAGAGGAALAGGLLLGAGTGELRRLFAGLAQPRQRLVLMVGALLVVSLVTGLAAAGALPEGLTRRLTRISLAERSAWERIVWTRDALSIVKDYPLLGLGGGGWGSRYFQYQSYAYFTRSVHNDVVEVWVETGTVGLAAFLVLLGGSVLGLARLRRRRDGPADETAHGGSPPFLAAGLGGAALMLVLHSGMDFNLAIPAVGIFLWGVLGMIDGLALAHGDGLALTTVAAGVPSPRGPRKRRRDAGRSRLERPPIDLSWPRLLGLGLATGIAITAVSLGTAASATLRGQTLLEDLRYAESRQAFARAMKLDPWSPDIRQASVPTLERLYFLASDMDALAEAKAQIRRSCRLDPYNPYRHAHYSVFALRYGDAATAILEMERALELHPFEPRRYEQVAHVHAIVGRDYLAAGDKARAQASLVKAAEVADRMALQAEKCPSYLPAEMALPSLSPAVALYSGQALALLGDWSGALEKLNLAYVSVVSWPARETPESAAARRGQAALWLAVLAEVEGRPAEARQYMSAAAAVLVRPDEGAAEIRSLLGLTTSGP